MLHQAPFRNHTWRRGRSGAVIQCTTPVAEPPASAPPPQRSPRQTDYAAPSASSGQERGFRRPAGRGAQRVEPQLPQSRARTQSQFEQQRPKLPSVAFLEDDAAQTGYKAKALFQRYLSQGTGVVVRSLGRQGAAAAMRFVLSVRDEGAAAAPQMDVRVKMAQQEPTQYFGTPLMLFVMPVDGREKLPEEDSVQCAYLTVSGRTDPSRLAKRLVFNLNIMEPGCFLRLDMVGAESLFRGLTALQEAQASIPYFASNMYLVPELVSMRARRQQPRDREQQQHEDAEQGEAPSLQQQQEEEEEDTSAELALSESGEPQRVQVLRLYVGAVPRPASKATGVASRGAPQSSGGSPAGSTAAAAAVGGGSGNDSKVLVSEAELQALKGALGTMMEQQKRLAEMISQRGLADGSVPQVPQQQ